MRHFSKRVAGSGLLVMAMTLGTSGDTAGSGRPAAAAPPRFVRAAEPDRIPGQYIVLLEDDTLPGDSVPFVADALTAEHGGAVRVTFQNAVRGFSANMTKPHFSLLIAYPKAWSPSTNGVVRAQPVYFNAKTDADLEKFAVDSAKADDIAVANVYTKAGAKVFDLDDATLAKWQALARPIWKDYSSKNENCAKLLAAAEKLL